MEGGNVLAPNPKKRRVRIPSIVERGRRQKQTKKGLTKCTANEFVQSLFSDSISIFLGMYFYVFPYTWGARWLLFFWQNFLPLAPMNSFYEFVAYLPRSAYRWICCWSLAPVNPWMTPSHCDIPPLAFLGGSSYSSVSGGSASASLAIHHLRFIVQVHHHQFTSYLHHGTAQTP